MNKEQQIKEIAEVIKNECDKNIGCIMAQMGEHSRTAIATSLYNTGYRKQSDVVKEFAECAITTIVEKYPVGRYTTNTFGDISEINKEKRKEFIVIVKEIAKEYGVEE